MRILVTTIPFSGMTISATICRKSLNERIASGGKQGFIEFINDPQVSLKLTRTHGGVLTTGMVSSTCKQDCATCADLQEHLISAPLNWVLQSESDRAAANDNLEDPGVLFYAGEHIDLEDPIQEALILALSPFWKPERSPDGVCSTCNRECTKASTPPCQSSCNTLESLLQKALCATQTQGKKSDA